MSASQHAPLPLVRRSRGGCAEPEERHTNLPTGRGRPAGRSAWPACLRRTSHSTESAAHTPPSPQRTLHRVRSAHSAESAAHTAPSRRDCGTRQGRCRIEGRGGGVCLAARRPPRRGVCGDSAVRWSNYAGLVPQCLQKWRTCPRRRQPQLSQRREGIAGSTWSRRLVDT